MSIIPLRRPIDEPIHIGVIENSFCTGEFDKNLTPEDMRFF